MVLENVEAIQGELHNADQGRTGCRIRRRRWGVLASLASFPSLARPFRPRPQHVGHAGMEQQITDCEVSSIV